MAEETDAGKNNSKDAQHFDEGWLRRDFTGISGNKAH